MQSEKNREIESALAWRYATKRFHPGKKISSHDWATLEQSIIQAPSSFGLQPWRFFVVADPTLRKRIREAAWNQAQIEDASHLVVFASRKVVGQTHIDNFMARIAEVRGVPVDSLAEFRKSILGFVGSPNLDVGAWATRQTYIALGMFLMSAAMLKIDACPMEGFNPSTVDEILGLSQSEFGSVVMATAGYRADDDAYASLKKVRFSRDEVIVTR